MDNAEEVLQIVERFTKLKQKDIPKELDEYIAYVAKTGDTVFSWSNIKYLFREKLLHVIKDFHDSTSNIDDLPQYPNVDPFNYETMKTALLERLELFNSAPFTIQRICELLTNPKKQYSRIDKYMRALEKNILVVSTIEPGRKQNDSENGDSLDSVVISLDVNVDIEMESENIFNTENQRQSNGSVSPSANNKCEAENNKTHDDVEFPLAKKPKLDVNEEENAKDDEINSDDKQNGDDSKDKDDSIKKSDNIISIKKNDNENETSVAENDIFDSEPKENDTNGEMENETKTNDDAEKQKCNETNKSNEVDENESTDIISKETSESLIKEKTSEKPAEDKPANKDDTQPACDNVDQQPSSVKENSPASKEEKESSSPTPAMLNESEKKNELFSTDNILEPSEKVDSVKETKEEAQTDKVTEPTDDLLKEEKKCVDLSQNKNESASSEKAETVEAMTAEESINIDSETKIEEKGQENTPTSDVASSKDITENCFETVSSSSSSSKPNTQPVLDDFMEEASTMENNNASAADTTPCVEMQTAADVNEMATDDVAPSKNDDKLETGGMEVDDLVQEDAMDQ